VFNTVLTGYQEVLTDPSYAGQIVAFTASHVGNYGTNDADLEAPRPVCRGMVVRELCDHPSNWRSEASLEAFLRRHGVPGLTGVDTRRLTRLVRAEGALPAALGTAPPEVLVSAARGEPGTTGRDLVAEVTPPAPRTRGAGSRTIVVYDYGVKEQMLRLLEHLGRLVIVPSRVSAEEALALSPDGVFLSNGPGDPSALEAETNEVARLLGRVPLFGICLGHQLLCRALGAATFKLPFGHHGGNHPVVNLATGRVEITSQNHNYAVDEQSLPASVKVSHRNLNDGVVEGVIVEEARAFGVQYHPEAGPGPHDARYLFEAFDRLMRGASVLG